MQPKISVIVPVYNVEAYLPRCLDSILSQTYENIQLILIDDGSADGSGAICDAYAAKDGRVQAVHQENAGIGHTRNVGLSLCQGDYIAFVDSDDHLCPDALRRLYDRLCADGSDMAIGNCVRVYEDGADSAPCYAFTDRAVSKEELLEEMAVFGAIPFAPWGKLYRRACMDGVVYPSVRIGEDTIAFPQILDRCRRISILSAPVYGYFQRDNSLMRQKNEAAKRGDVHVLLHTARYLWDNRCPRGAANWYAAAAKNALTIRRRTDRLAEFTAFFDHRTRRMICRQMDRRGRLAWLCLHVPLSDRLLSKMLGK